MNTILCYIYPDMADFEVVVALHRLRNAGKRRIITVAETKDAVVSQSGLRYVPDMTLAEAAAVDAEALIIPGGPINNDQNAVLPLIRRMDAQGKLLAAICFGPQFLGRAGVLDGRRFTTSCTEAHIAALGVCDPFPREKGSSTPSAAMCASVQDVVKRRLSSTPARPRNCGPKQIAASSLPCASIRRISGRTAC